MVIMIHNFDFKFNTSDQSLVSCDQEISFSHYIPPSKSAFKYSVTGFGENCMCVQEQMSPLEYESAYRTDIYLTNVRGHVRPT